MLKLQEPNAKTETGDNYSSLEYIAALDRLKSAEEDKVEVCNGKKLKLYAEAVDAIQRVLEDTSDLKSDKTKLKLIQEGYLKRIEFLSSFKNPDMNSTKNPSNRISLMRTPSSVKNIFASATTNTKSASAVVALSSVFSKNKRLSNYSVPQYEEVKHLSHSRKSSFFNIKPSKSTPTMEKQKGKRESAAANKRNILNRYSSDFSRLGNILLSRNPVVIGDTTPVITPSSSTLLSFDNLYSNEEERNAGLDSEIQQHDPLIEPSSRSSTDSASVTTVMISTPSSQEQNLSLSNSGSTADEDIEELPVVEELWETQVIVADSVDIPVVKKMESSFLASRALGQIPVNNHSQEVTQPLQKSSSTSSFQSLLRRSKSTKKKDRLSSSTENSDSSKKKSTFATYIQTTTKQNRKVIPSDSDKSKSRKKWSLHISTGSGGNKIPLSLTSSILDPTTFLADPFLPSPNEPKSTQSTNETIVLMNKLLESMINGGRVTSKLYIPMDLWYQTNVRLPATDAKIAACELILVALERMHERDNFKDCTAVENDLKLLEQTLLQIKYTLIKKLGFNISDDPHSSYQMQSSSRYSSYIGSLIGGSSGVKTSQNASTWSSKLTKSVERMKLEASKAIPNGDQNAEYIKALIRLFNMTKVLDKWNTELLSMVGNEKCKKPILYERASNTNDRCIRLLKMTVCQFVLKDYETLLDKWLKRSMDWAME